MYLEYDRVPAADRRDLLAIINKLADGIFPRAACRHLQKKTDREAFQTIIRESPIGRTKRTLLWSIGLDPRPANPCQACMRFRMQLYSLCCVRITTHSQFAGLY